MENTPHTNGKSTLVHTPIAVAPSEQSRLGMTPSHPRYARVLDLVRDAVDLEFRLKATMNELDQEMRLVGSGELPAVLMTLMKTQQPISPKPKTPVGLAKARPRTKQHVVTNKGGRLKAQVMGLMSDGKERKSLAIVKALKAKNPSSVYSILSELTTEGHLLRTRFAHYRLKMRKA